MDTESAVLPLYPPLFVVILVLAVSLYNTRNRPKVPLPPGPPSDPIIGHLRVFPTQDVEATLHEWSKQYGDVMSFSLLGQRIIVLGSRDAAVDLLEKRGALYSCRPRIVVYKLMGADPNLPFLPYGPMFRKHRKLMGPALSQESCRQFEDMQRENAVLLVDALIKNRGEDFEQSLGMFTTAVIVRVAIGHQILSDQDEFIQIASDVQSALLAGGVPGMTPIDWLPLLQYLPSWFPGTHYANEARKWYPAIRKLYDYPYNLVWMQMNKGTARRSYLLKLLQDLPSSPTEEDVFNLKGATAVMYAGGAETTWSSMSSFFLAMTLHPECQKVAQEEIDRVIGRDRLPTLKDRDDLPYISAVVQEALRWGRIAPLGVPHRSIQDDVFRGMFIPKGSLILTNIYGMSRDESIYEKPEMFNPMRFFPTSSGGNAEPPFGDVFGFGRYAPEGILLQRTYG
ncbi:hypothetical protein ONZ45_g2493 [Pleurotus djamor]|nr:hypothetical protein ONZ45_g2493 [Pleurotus djamor]